jgi:hypothetical protein
MRLAFLILLTVLLVLLIPLQAKSVPKAMLLSAVMPGTGEIYAGNLSRGVFFITTDLLILFNANRYGSEVKWLQNSYKQFAFSKAGIPKNRDSDYYNLIQKWYSSDDYNAEMELYFRNLGLYETNNPDQYDESIELYRIDGDYTWQWQNTRDWTKYKNIRRDKQTMVMNQKLAIGAAIANRVISAIDAAYLTKTQNRRINTSFNIEPDFINNGAILNCTLEF